MLCNFVGLWSASLIRTTISIGEFSYCPIRLLYWFLHGVYFLLFFLFNLTSIIEASKNNAIYHNHSVENTIQRVSLKPLCKNESEGRWVEESTLEDRSLALECDIVLGIENSSSDPVGFLRTLGKRGRPRLRQRKESGLTTRYQRNITSLFSLQPLHSRARSPR